MARARVEIQEQAQDTRVPSFPGLYGGIVVPLKKGEVNVPRLVTNESDFLRNLTPDETIKIGYDVSHFSVVEFLKYSNKMWVVRAANNPLYGGALLSQDPPFTSLEIYANSANNTFSLRTTTDSQKANAEIFYTIVHTAEKVGFSSDGVLPAELNSSAVYFLFNMMETNGVYTFQIANTKEDAENGVAVAFTDNGTGNHSILLKGTNTNASLTRGLLDPTAYLMDSSDGRVAGLTSVFETDVERDSFQVSTKMYDMAATGDRVQITGTTFPTADTGNPLAAGIDYYLIKVPDYEEVQLARSLSDASLGVFIPISSLGSDLVISLMDKTNTSSVLANTATNDFQCDAAFYLACATGDVVRMSSLVEDFPTPEIGAAIDGSTDYFLIKTAVTNRVQIALSLSDAFGGTAIGISTAGTSLSLTLQDKEATSVSNPDLSNDKITVDPTFFEWIIEGDRVQVSSDGTLPGGLSPNTNYYVIKGETYIKLAISTDAVAIGEAIDITSPGIGIHTILNLSNEQLIGLEQYCLLFHGSNQGAWNKDIYVRTLHYPYGDQSTWSAEQQSAADEVKEPDCFLVYVYKKNNDGSVTLVEDPWLCSRIKGKKDGYNRNVYVEDALEASNYIRAIDNDLVDQSIYPKNQTQILMLNGGHDGGQVTDSNMLQALEPLGNRRNIFVTLLMDGGWTTPAYQLGMISVCHQRKDCMAIFTIPFAAENSSNYMNEILKYKKETLNSNSTYGGIYASHVLIQDKYNDRKIYASTDGFVGAAISKTALNYAMWVAPAGADRGQLDVLDVRRRFTEGEMDLLYDNSINPIDFYPGKGIRIWGQKTLTSRPESRDRINVRLLLIVIEPAIQEFLDNFLFNSNDALTRALAESGITSYMESIKSGGGVYSFKAVCSTENNTPEDIDANRMRVWLYVAPVKSAEDIRFTTIITRTGSSFTPG